MNIKLIPLIIALAIASLCGYGFFAISGQISNRLLLTIGSGLSLGLTLIGTLALNVKGHGGTGNIRVVSLIFFVIFLLSNIIFSFVGVPQAPYIIVNGIILLVYLLSVYGITKSRK